MLLIDVMGLIILRRSVMLRFLAGFAWLNLGLFVGVAVAEACSEPERPVRRPWLVGMEMIKEADSTTDILVEVTGPAISSGAAPGNSCGLVASVPKGMTVSAVDIVNAEDGTSVGFGKFSHDEPARKISCADSESHSCSVFLSTVGESGVRKGVPLKFILRLSSSTNSKQLGSAISRISTSNEAPFNFVAGQFEDGVPGGHLLAFSPDMVELKFEEH